MQVSCCHPFYDGDSTNIITRGSDIYSTRDSSPNTPGGGSSYIRIRTGFQQCSQLNCRAAINEWISESTYLLVKTVRPAPGAQSRPRANPERGGGEPGAPILRVSKPASGPSS